MSGLRDWTGPWTNTLMFIVRPGCPSVSWKVERFNRQAIREKASSFHILRHIPFMIMEEFNVAGDFDKSIRIGQIYATTYPGDHKMEEFYQKINML